MLAPPGTPLHRSRAERFDDLVLQAVAQLEPRWQPSWPASSSPSRRSRPLTCPMTIPIRYRWAARSRLAGSPPGRSTRPSPARIVLYRRPLLARAEGEEELGELVLDVVVEEFAQLLGIDPEVVDPGYPDE